MEKVKIRGNNYCYADRNKDKKEVILLVHGHPFNHSMWKYQYETLKEFRLILPDLIGYGKSDFDFDRVFIEEQALDLALLLDQLGIEKVHLIGLSMGGQIIVEFCRLFPERAKSLIICASTPKAENPDSYSKRLKLAREISNVGMLKHTKNTISNYINTGNYGQESEVYGHLFKMMSTTPTIGAVASHKGRAERRDNADYLAKINIPAMVVAAEKDFFFEISDVKSVADSIPVASFRLIVDSGHLPNMEKPEEFNRLLEDFYQVDRK